MAAPPPPPAPSPSARAPWAKSGQKSAHTAPGGGGWLPVLHHLLDVAACADEVLEREPARTRALSRPTAGRTRPRPGAGPAPWPGYTTWARRARPFNTCGRRARRGSGTCCRCPRLLTSPPPRTTPHGTVTGVLLPGLLVERGWSRAVAGHAADALACHHGFRTPTGLVPDFGREEAWRDVRRELLAAVLAAFDLGDAPPPLEALSGTAYMHLAGLTSFADWIGSSFALEAVPDEGASSDPRAALDGIGWTPRRPLHDEVPEFEAAFGFAPRPLQTLLAGALDPADPRPLLAVVEAPMGEGKMEAALHAFLHLQRAAGHRGLYVVLPTWATGNATYTRLRKFPGEQLSGRADDVTVDLQLLHGGTALNPAFQSERAATDLARERPPGSRCCASIPTRPATPPAPGRRAGSRTASALLSE